ncbi:MAG: hypothetical protein IJ298_03560 [Ruminococcus sp.]|nr:hypothetical protein [Ruminococcus sp.]
MADNNTENKTTEAKDVLPYSYHTFMFPFLWNNGGKKIKREDFVKCLDETLWYRENRLDEKIDGQSLIAEYNTYHYFNPAARNAVYGGEEDDSVVWNYCVDVKRMAENLLHKKTNTPAWLGNSKDKNNPAQYVIFRKYIKKDKEKGEEPDVERKSININGIRLKLFNTGIGILIFELENYTYQEPDDINWINEFGRRIYMPYLKNVDFCDGCAQEIYLEYEGKRIVEGWFNIKPKSPRDTKLAAPITYLLSNGDYTVTTDEKANNEKLFFIEPIVDDRMFVACYYINVEYANWLCEKDGASYCYLTDSQTLPLYENANRSSSLYKLVFVDSSYLSCQSTRLLYQMLENHIYDRWVDWKSLTGVSEYSMITVTNETEEYLARNFLTEYVEMMILVLAQRASLLAFERMISDSTLGRADISEIQTKYIRFQSQLLLKEVTPQQQGIELYKMLLSNLFIAEQTAEVEKQIESLAAHKSSQSESKENLILFFIAVLGVFETINCLADWWNFDEFHWLRITVAVIVTIGAVVAYFVSKDKLKTIFKSKKK